jgi:hypothetical protein
LSDAEIKILTDNIIKLGFDVEQNTLSFPDSVNQSTLVYSPLSNDHDKLDRLMTILSEINWPISNTELMVSGTHWFSKDSVGIFLLPEGINKSEKVIAQDLVNEYTSSDCDKSVNITLYDDRTYQIIFSAPLNNASENTEYLTGTWAMRSYPYIDLTSLDGYRWSFFEIEQKTTTDKISEIEKIILTPLDRYRSIEGCRFTHGLRA